MSDQDDVCSAAPRSVYERLARADAERDTLKADLDRVIADYNTLVADSACDVFTTDEFHAIVNAINYACQGINGEAFRRNDPTIRAYEKAQKRLRDHYANEHQHERNQCLSTQTRTR